MTATLRAVHWDGPLPIVGQFIKSARGRTAYLLVEVIPAKPGLKYVAKFRCERRPAGSLHATDIVHPWKWSKR